MSPDSRATVHRHAACRVLYVEDDQEDERALVTAVQELGLPYALTVARSTAEARTLLGGERFDIVLTGQRLADGAVFDLPDPRVRQATIVLVGDGEEEIAARTLHPGVGDVLVKDARRAYLRLLPWRVDAVLRQAHDNAAQGRHHDDVLDSVDDEIAVVDASGVITLVNRAWRRFAQEHGASNPSSHIGLNYLEVCRRAARLPAGAEAAAVGAGLEAVLAGTRDRFELDYPCHTPSEQRWFVVTITRLTGPRAGAVVAHRAITDRYRAEQGLRRAKELLDRTGELARVGGWEVDLATMKLSWTQETFRIADIDSGVEPPLEDGINLFAPEARPVIAAAVQAAIDHGTPYDLELPIITAKGRHRWVQTQGFAERKAGTSVRLFGTFQDITERRQAALERDVLESRLAQSQKLEAIGRLAGGVAHDFNNMLAIILGHTELALRRTDPADPLHRDLVEVQSAAQRSAALTGQLLAFARKQEVVPRPLDINGAVAGMLSLLQRLLGEDIAVVWQPSAAWRVWMDPSQLDQILTNLCVNARDAIAGVGSITIRTSDRVVEASEGAGDGVPAGALPGEYVVVSVTDTGHGMDAATMGNIFEPFFTTKGLGAGTGLGLAMVEGAVRQNGGFISVASAVGQGTTFDVFLPRYLGGFEPATAAFRPSAVPAADGRTILLVEDEPGILRLADVLLSSRGHVVLAASSPREAIRMAQAHAGPIDLLLTDVIMPDMNGQQLAAEVRACSPHLKVLFMSGYTDDVISRRGVLPSDVHFLQKPFVAQDLYDAVQKALAAGGDD